MQAACVKAYSLSKAHWDPSHTSSLFTSSLLNHMEHDLPSRESFIVLPSFVHPQAQHNSKCIAQICVTINPSKCKNSSQSFVTLSVLVWLRDCDSHVAAAPWSGFLGNFLWEGEQAW